MPSIDPRLWAIRWPAFIVCSVAAHAALLLLWAWNPQAEAAQAEVLPENVIDVEFLIEAPPEPEPPIEEIPPPPPEPPEEEPPPEPKPEPPPEPEPEIKVEEVPPPPKEEPKPEPKKVEEPPKPKPKPKPTPKRASRPPAPKPPARNLATAPSVTRRYPPAYPRNALRLKTEGDVHVKITISASGRVANAAIHRSSGHRDLDGAALSSVRRWRFSPARNSAGTPISSQVIVPIQFRVQ